MQLHKIHKETKEYMHLLIGFEVLAEELNRGLYMKKPKKTQMTLKRLLQDSYRILQINKQEEEHK